MEENDNKFIIKAIFDSSNYGKVSCTITIKKGVALAIFSDKRLAKDMYYAEKKLAIDDVYYNERLGALGTKYPGKTSEEIAKMLLIKLKDHNVEVINKKNDKI